MKILLVTAPFYKEINDMQIAGASEALAAVGAEIEIIEVPGALEIPGAVSMAATTGSYDGYVALGCVIRGETTHYDIVAEQSALGLQYLAMNQHLAIGNGILTVENKAQATARADKVQMNKGGGAAEACLAMIALKKTFTI